MSAASSVSRNAHLLITILEYLDERTLLLSQRVSRHFHFVINNTQALQHRLFLRAEPYPQVVEPTALRLNPLIATLEIAWDRESRGGPLNSSTTQRYTTTYFWGSSQEPLLLSSFMQPPARYGGRHAHEARHRPRFQQGSWQRMLLIQPPVETLVRMLYHDEDVGDPFPCSHSLPAMVDAGIKCATFFALEDIQRQLAYAAVHDALYHVSADFRAGLITAAAVYGSFATHDAWFADLCDRAGIDASDANDRDQWLHVNARNDRVRNLLQARGHDGGNSTRAEPRHRLPPSHAVSSSTRHVW